MRLWLLLLTNPTIDSILLYSSHSCICVLFLPLFFALDAFAP